MLFALMPRVGPELAQSWPRTGQGVDRESAVVATGAWSRSSWQLNALIRVLSTSLADKHADTLNWVLLQLLLPASLPPCALAACQLRLSVAAAFGFLKLPNAATQKKLLPLEFLMPIKYAVAGCTASTWLLAPPASRLAS